MASNWADRVEELTGVDGSCTVFFAITPDNDDSHMDKLYGLIDRCARMRKRQRCLCARASVVADCMPCSSRRST